MINTVTFNIIRFIIVVLIQGLILNNIQLSGFINPYFYILFVILLPFETPKWLLLLSAFFLGLSVDAFTNTAGMHASASVFLAFARPYILQLQAPRDGYDSGTTPSVADYGIPWFLKYTFFATFLHHIFLFYVESFTFSDFFGTFARVLFSTFFSLLLILISQLFTYKK